MKETFIQKGILLLKRENPDINKLIELFHTNFSRIGEEFERDIVHDDNLFKLTISTLFHTILEEATKRRSIPAYEIRTIIKAAEDLPLEWGFFKIEVKLEVLIKNIEQLIQLRNTYESIETIPTWMDLSIWKFAFKINELQKRENITINIKEIERKLRINREFLIGKRKIIREHIEKEKQHLEIMRNMVYDDHPSCCCCH